MWAGGTPQTLWWQVAQDPAAFPAGRSALPWALLYVLIHLDVLTTHMNVAPTAVAATTSLAVSAV